MTLNGLTISDLLKVMEIMKVVDGSATGDAIKSAAYQEFKMRIGFDESMVPEREFINIDTSKNATNRGW